MVLAALRGFVPHFQIALRRSKDRVSIVKTTLEIAEENEEAVQRILTPILDTVAQRMRDYGHTSKTVITSARMAAEYSVRSFLEGNSLLPEVSAEDMAIAESCYGIALDLGYPHKNALFAAILGYRNLILKKIVESPQEGD